MAGWLAYYLYDYTSTSGGNAHVFFPWRVGYKGTRDKGATANVNLFASELLTFFFLFPIHTKKKNLVESHLPAIISKE